MKRLLIALVCLPQMAVAQSFVSPMPTFADLAAMQCKYNYVASTPVTIGNTTTETSIASTPQQGSLTIPSCVTSAAFELQVHVDGYYTAATVAPGTLTQYIKFNGVPVCSVVLGNLATTGANNLGAHGNAYVVVSSTGLIRCTGFLGYQITANGEAPGYWSTVGTPTITPGSTITLDYTGKWSAAVNTITATQVFATVTR